MRVRAGLVGLIYKKGALVFLNFLLSYADHSCASSSCSLSE